MLKTPQILYVLKKLKVVYQCKAGSLYLALMGQTPSVLICQLHFSESIFFLQHISLTKHNQLVPQKTIFFKKLLFLDEVFLPRLQQKYGMDRGNKIVMT